MSLNIKLTYNIFVCSIQKLYFSLRHSRKELILQFVNTKSEICAFAFSSEKMSTVEGEGSFSQIIRRNLKANRKKRILKNIFNNFKMFFVKYFYNLNLAVFLYIYIFTIN